MRVDSDVLATFKARAEMIGDNYQTLMDDVLKQFAQGLKLSDTSTGSYPRNVGNIPNDALNRSREKAPRGLVFPRWTNTKE